MKSKNHRISPSSYTHHVQFMSGLRDRISKRKIIEDPSWLDITDKTLSVLIKAAFFAPIFGGALLLRYLVHIEKPYLFMPAISSLNGLAALFLGSILLCFAVAILFLMPYWVARFALHEHMKLFPAASIPGVRILFLFLSFPAMLVVSEFLTVNFWLLFVLVICQALIVLLPIKQTGYLIELQLCKRWLVFVGFLFILLGLWYGQLNPWLFYALYLSLSFVWLFPNSAIEQIDKKHKSILRLSEWRKKYYFNNIICRIPELVKGTWHRIKSCSLEHIFNWMCQLVFLTLSVALTVYSYDVINKISANRGAEEWLTIGLFFIWPFVIGLMLISQFTNRKWEIEGIIFGGFSLFIVIYFNLEIAVGAPRFLGMQSDVKKWYWVVNMKKLENILPDSICRASSGVDSYIYAATQFSFGNTTVLCSTGSNDSCKDNSKTEKSTLEHCVIVNNSDIRLTDTPPSNINLSKLR